MKLIYNNFIPCKGFKAINIFGVLFVRKGATVDERMLNHEAIHTAQMNELLYIFFYVFYIVDWLIGLMAYVSFSKAYRDICFEKEAYQNEGNINYLKSRKPFAFIKYLK
jgi:hypothetical protein